MSGLSYWHEPLVAPHLGLRLHELLSARAAESADCEAYVVRQRGQPRRAVTFGALHAETRALAAALLQRGLRPGDFCIITGITCVDWLRADFACACIGVRTVRCRMSVLTREGLLTIANSNGVRAIVFHPGEQGEFEQHLRKCVPDAFEQRGPCADIPSLRLLVRMGEDDGRPEDGIPSVTQLMAAGGDTAAVDAAQAQVDADDVLTCYMTSGSTGFPKAIPYTHFKLLNTYRHCRFFGETAKTSDVILNDRSLAWLGGMAHATLSIGCTTVYMHPLTNASDNDVDYFIQVAKEERVTAGVLLQYILIDILERFESGAVEPFHLEWGVSGGEVINGDLLKRASRYCGYLSVGYGLTETSFVATGLRSDSLAKTVQYAGHVERGVEVKVVDSEGRRVPFGETGEIAVRSPLAFDGYLQKEAKGAKRDASGWVYTDDAGCLTSDGYVKVYGRRSHVISRGITLTYPIVVERMILQFPGVSKVCVIGVPDRRLGQNICAAIIPNKGVTLTKEDMLKCFDDLYKTDEGLGMTPAYFMFMEEFPTVNAKMDKTTLKRMAIEKFGLHDIQGSPS